MATTDPFTSAQERVKRLSRRPTNGELLDLYALYKQGTDGDVRGSRPGLLDPKGRAKYDAWASRRGVTRDDARTRYVALVAELARKSG